MQLTDAWVQNVLLRINKTSPAYGAVNSALKNGTLVKGIAGVDRTTGALTIIRIK
jgi:filamentous hemagglutinin